MSCFWNVLSDIHNVLLSNATLSQGQQKTELSKKSTERRDSLDRSFVLHHVMACEFYMA